MSVAFLYESDAHVERPGIVGRQVAGSEFIDAYLRHGQWQNMVAVVRNQASRDSIAARFREHLRAVRSAQSLAIVPMPAFHERFFPEPPARSLHLPYPLEPELAWARHHAGPHAFSLSGITHTISTRGVMQRFCNLVTGPFEAYDTMFCISRASIQVLRSAADNYCAWLKERHGGAPALRARLEHVPLGIDTSKFRPPTPDERAEVRRELGIADDELVVLFVGRLNYFGKVHPFPMYRGVAEAARRTGAKVRLILAGWAEQEQRLEHFREGAAALAPGVPVTFVDGTQPQWRFRVWHAADVFTSLSDNIQETLSQTILEGQACGLPVVVTDWDGCRDQVEQGVTGYRVPTRSVQGATVNGTSRYLIGESSYDEFLGETNQSISVDVAATRDAFVRLFSDAALRARMAAAGRERICAHFTWQLAVERHETVWREQEQVRSEHAAASARVTSLPFKTPVPFPDVETSFASYPAELLGAAARFVTADDAEQQLVTLLGLPLSNYRGVRRVTEHAALARVLAGASQPVLLARVEELLGAGTASERSRATIAWLLKYDLLRLVSDS